MYFFRKPTPLDQQTVVRMNRDTLYGGAVVDTTGGATITFPHVADGRYASILVLDNDHYAPMVIYEPGTYRLPDRTRYVVVVVRVHLRKPSDPSDIAAANAVQDGFKITAASATPFPKPQWDQASLDALRAQYEREFVQYDAYPDDWQGAPGEVNEKTRHLAAAGAWGLFPNKDALYLNFEGNLPLSHCYQATYTVPENEAFWSITMYGSDGYMKSDTSVLNQFNTVFNPDGTFTVHFGSQDICGDVANRLDVTEEWNFLMRVYRPGKSVLDGSYKLPSPKAVV